MEQIIAKIVIDGDCCTIFPNMSSLGEFITDPFYYRCQGQNLRAIPEAILAVPYYLNMAPVIWRSGQVLRTELLEPVLANALEKIRHQFSAMDGEGAKWSGRLESAANSGFDFLERESESSVILFSGGVDSWATTLLDKHEGKSLVLVRGNDIELQNDKAWKNVRMVAQRQAKALNADLFFVESNVFDFLNHARLGSLLNSHENWWGTIQHGMGLSGLMAIPCWITGARVAIISATHSQGYDKRRWGSSPEIDNLIQWNSVSVQHHGYELSRQDKIRLLARRRAESELPISLRVCFRTEDGTNCGRCEKCLRTAAGLVLEDSDPKVFGFPISSAECVSRVREMISARRLPCDPNTEFHWKVLIKRAMEVSPNAISETPQKTLATILNAFDLEGYSVAWRKRRERKTRIKKILRKIPLLENTGRYFYRFLR